MAACRVMDGTIIMWWICTVSLQCGPLVAWGKLQTSGPTNADLGVPVKPGTSCSLSLNGGFCLESSASKESRASSTVCMDFLSRRSVVLECDTLILSVPHVTI
ncbi:hypothetical protein B0H66DRAFT_547417 [Apodospora peruviana]|uniref:Secreted protein n=1 Tax=Apodospora peruviana TaxID=516989 RepID=A0AAE0II30_9PEZI|nr:hypothetical protein B0H66DRAFT_547417 [Apodospora peruviana]